MKRKRMERDVQSLSAPTPGGSTQIRARLLSDDPIVAQGSTFFPVFIALTTVAVFLPVLKNGFVGLDVSRIVENASYG